MGPLRSLRPRTLQLRLTVAAAAAIVVAVVAFASVTAVIVDHELHASLDTALRQRALSVAQLAVSAPAVLDRPGALEGTASGRQVVVEVLDRRGGLLARSSALGARLLPALPVVRGALRRGDSGFADARVAGRPLRLFAAPIAQAGGPAAGGAVLTASDTGDIGRTTGRVGAAVVILGAVVVVLTVLAAALLTRRVLGPLRRLAAAAQAIERTPDPARRLPATAGADEIAQLTGVLNRMLGSLQSAQETERRFLADASHELRTPITALLGNVRFAQRHGADDEVLADLRLDAERLGRLVDALLALERAGHGDPERRPVALADTVAAALASLGDPERVTVTLPGPGPGPVVAGDAGALARAIANLVENALVHGPAGGPVEVAVGVRDGEATVTVSDAGPGPDPDAGERPFARFWRGPDASGRPGSGLGLSIVAAIAAAHGGQVTVRGSAFQLALPLGGAPGSAGA